MAEVCGKRGEGVDVMASATDCHDTITYGAIGVGNLKMKIHKQSLRRLFEANDLVLDVEEIFAIGREIDANPG